VNGVSLRKRRGGGLAEGFGGVWARRGGVVVGVFLVAEGLERGDEPVCALVSGCSQRHLPRTATL